MLCLGLDTDASLLPKGFEASPKGMLAFNKAILEATLHHAVAVKINTAFYEAYGSAGWQVLENTLALIPDSVFKIADAKRGDIGNTSKQYAKAFFNHLPFDAVTLSPYMGLDSLEAFLDYPDKTAIILALTSNAGSADFETLQTPGGLVYEEVIRRFVGASSSEKPMFVVGATKPESFRRIRESAPDHFLLVPGVGAQGGDAATIIHEGGIQHNRLLINASRSIIYASREDDFQEAAAKAALALVSEMQACRP